jgi:hypothetical protein
MSIAPAVDVTLGGLRYDTHVSSLRVTLALLPAVNSFTLSLPSQVKFTAGIGDVAALTLDGGDAEGDGARQVLAGKVRSIRRTLDAIEVTGADAGSDLAALRPAKTFSDMSVADFVQALDGEVGASVGEVSAGLKVAAYAAHQGRTAAEQIEYLARLAGCIAHVDGDGRLNVVARPSDRADAALLHGREIIEFERREGASPPQQVAIGNGTAGSTSAPDALKHSLGRLPSNAASPGASARWHAAAVLRTPSAAGDASDALSAYAAAFSQQMRARCFLLTGLRPGMVVEVQELPDALSGTTWMLTRVTHRLAPSGGGETVLEGVMAGASGGLLGALAGAIGGLL